MAIDPCTEYGLALAIEDFVPVLLAGAGLVVLANALGKAIPAVRVGALLGGLVVTAGGLGKAVWKLLVAGPCVEIPFLEQMLFPCLAIGFSAIAWALASVYVGKVVSWAPFALVPFVGACISGAARNLTPMLAIAALSAVAVGAMASALARRHGDQLGRWLFIFYLVGTLVLPPLAARPNQTEALQWIEQLTNSGVQLCFLIGALRLSRRLPHAERPSVPEGASLS
ncbi:hypothetical protein KV102_16240 [Mumia sp. zg.B53]|uniref:hypothetical protein n=1 Tax=Mumia sp. zg.B53 TaxID=2855449 RepID=UPI001C6EB5D9|nr:hypothetical protein [Mumia sp. zg.B53]MBW9216389.1 hypothetical protein [Mumia sp. zg.B53]